MKICFCHLLSTMINYFHARNQKKIMIQFFTKSKKPVFQPFFDPNLPKICFFENRAPSHSRVYSHAPLCQKSENLNEPISRKAGNRRTDERTNGRTWVNLQDHLQVGPKIHHFGEIQRKIVFWDFPNVNITYKIFVQRSIRNQSISYQSVIDPFRLSILSSARVWFKKNTIQFLL